MLSSRVAVRAPFDAVTLWGAQQPGRCLVTDAGDGWSIADLDGPSDEALAGYFGQDVIVLEEEDVWRVDATGGTELLPMWVDDPADESEVAAFDRAWDGIPDLLTGADPRLVPPRARQTLVMPTPGEEELHAALAGMALAVSIVDVDGWTVVAADEDLVPVAAGLTAARRRWALVLATDDRLGSVQLVARGRLRGETVWNRRSALVGLGTTVDATWGGVSRDPVDAAELASLVGTQGAKDNVPLIRAVLRREGAPLPVLDELLSQLGLGAAQVLASDVLRGRQLANYARARRVEPPASFGQFLRAGASGAFLDPDAVPWFSILCTALFPFLVVNLCFRAFQLVTGTLDAWGAAQLVGALVNAPLAFLFLRRVVQWRDLRRAG